MNIAFWSNVAGKGATSGNMLAVSTMASVLYSLKTVLVQTDRMSKPLDEVFEGKRSENMVNEEFQFYNKKGMDELIERARLDLLCNEIVQTNMVNVRHTNMYYIPPSRNEIYDSIEAVKTYELLMAELKEMGGLNFWDVSNGQHLSSKTILSKSDVVVINLCQEPDNIKLPIEDECIMKKAVFLLGKYDNASRKGLVRICKEYGIPKGKVAVIPYNIHFHDAVYDGKVVPFIMKNIFSKKHEANFDFINNVFKATNLVLKEAGVEGVGE